MLKKLWSAKFKSPLRRHSEQMKVLLVPLGLMRGITLPQSTDQGALTEKQKGMVHRLST